MNQKGFAHVIIIIGILVFALAGVSVLVVTNKRNVQDEGKTDQKSEETISESESENTEEFTNIEPTNTPAVVLNPTTKLAPTLTPIPTIPPLRSFTANGFAYEDRNDDGLYNSADPKIANMQLYVYDSYNSSRQLHTIYSGADGSFSTTLNVRGNIILKPTSYNNFVPKTGQIEYGSSGQSHSFGFRSSSAPADSNVGIIEGDIYHDTNQNQTRDGGESSTYFYKLYLIDGNGSYYNTVENAQTTDAGGHFKYINLPVPGTYTIKLSNPTGDYIIYKPESTVSLFSGKTEDKGIQIPVFKNN